MSFSSDQMDARLRFGRDFVDAVEREVRLSRWSARCGVAFRWILAAVGLLVLFGIGLAWVHHARLGRMPVVEGRVTGYVTEKNSPARVSYRFEHGTVQWSGESPVLARDVGAAGEPIAIHYDPMRPKSNRAVAAMHPVRVNAPIAVFTGALFAFGIAGRRQRCRQREQAAAERQFFRLAGNPDGSVPPRFALEQTLGSDPVQQSLLASWAASLQPPDFVSERLHNQFPVVGKWYENHGAGDLDGWFSRMAYAASQVDALSGRKVVIEVPPVPHSLVFSQENDPAIPPSAPILLAMARGHADKRGHGVIRLDLSGLSAAEVLTRKAEQLRAERKIRARLFLTKGRENAAVQQALQELERDAKPDPPVSRFTLDPPSEEELPLLSAADSLTLAASFLYLVRECPWSNRSIRRNMDVRVEGSESFSVCLSFRPGHELVLETVC